MEEVCDCDMNLKKMNLLNTMGMMCMALGIIGKNLVK